MLHPGVVEPYVLVMVLYLNPRDYPRKLVLRGWAQGPERMEPSEHLWVMEPRDIEVVRTGLRAAGYRSVPVPEDWDPSLIEEWVPVPATWGRG